MAMELINVSDMRAYTPYSVNTDAQVFTSELQQVQDRLGAWISDEMVTAILDLTRDTDTSEPLYQYWYNYVRPFVVHSVFVGMADTFGYQFAPNGITTFKDGKNTAGEVSPQQRSALVRKWTESRELWLTRMLAEFSNQNGTFDGVVYTVDPDKYDVNSRKKPALNVIGGINKFLPYNNKFRL